MSFAASMQLRTLSIEDKTSEPKLGKLKRMSTERRAQLILFFCLPVVFSSSSPPPARMIGSRIAETGPKNPNYRSRVIECRYPAMPDVSLVLSSMKHFPREEFSSSIKDCADPRDFRWSTII